MSKRSSIAYAGKANYFVLHQSVKKSGRSTSLKEQVAMKKLVEAGVNSVAIILTSENMQALLRDHDELFTFEGEYDTRGWRGDMPYLRVMEIIKPYALKTVPLSEKWENLPKIRNDRSAAWEQIACSIVSEITGIEFQWTGLRKTEKNGYFPDGIAKVEDSEIYLEAKGRQSVFSCKGSITVKQGRAE